MITESTLTIKIFPIQEVGYGDQNKVSMDGHMVLRADALAPFVQEEPLVAAASLRIILPEEHDQHTNTIMDVIPISTKALGRLGEGTTYSLGGVYVLLTGIDEDGRQVCNFGACNGILRDSISWGQAGTPDEMDTLISCDVILKAGAWTERAGVDAAHRVCDRFCQIFREQMKSFNGNLCAEKHVFENRYSPGNKDVVIVKEVSGQGAVYDTHLFPEEPAGFIGSRSIIDMDCMPVILSPNEYRDGVLHALD